LAAVILIVLAAVFSLAVYSIYVEPRMFRTVKARMCARNDLGHRLEILHISDLHFRKGDEAKLRFLQGLRKIPVDLVFVTGDMIEGDSGIDFCIETLGGYSPRIGVFAVFGAHDRWYSPLPNVVLDLGVGGYHEGPPNDFERLRRGLADAGVVCLENESRRVALPESHSDGKSGVKELWIVGIDDMFVGRDDLDAALAGVPNDAFRILLTHTVESPEELAARGFDAVFAGHSHGGQVRLPLLGPIMTRSGLKRKHASGVFEVERTPFHINNGIGAGEWTPFRFMCPPEATLITLTARGPEDEPVA